MKKVLFGLILIASVAAATTNEITANIDLQVSKNSLQLQKNSGSQIIQMAGTRFYSAVYALTTTNQPMSKGAVGSLGWCYARNFSTNKTVYLSFDVGATTNMMFLPSEAVIFRLADTFQVTNIHAAVTSGTADFEFTIIEK